MLNLSGNINLYIFFMSLKSQIPNCITLLNLFCGCIALVFVSKLNFEMAFLFVGLGIFLDFFDGFFARLFKVQSALGLQLDSLADMVTSGVVPGYVMVQLLQFNGGFQEVSNESSILNFSLLGFVITLGACYRLANFNIDSRQTDSFIGLPTPANALFILSLPLVLQNSSIEIVTSALQNKYVLLAITLLSAFVMNAELPLFSLKVKQFSFQKNRLQIIFLVLSLALFLIFQYLGIPLVIIFYVLLSLINNLVLSKE